MGLEEIFTEQNMLKYSESCVDLAMSLTNLKKEKPSFDTLVIPSRGAVPFFLGMTYALKKFAPVVDDIKQAYESIAIQPMLEPLMPKDTCISANLDKKSLRVLMIPFTADLNIPMFDPEERNEEYTEKTRDYWARVTHAFFRNPSSKIKNPYFKTFTDIILKDIEDRGKTAEIYERFPMIKSFAMIDTVISGRASNDILGAFDDIAQEEKDSGESHFSDVPPFAFLIADENGKKLEKHRPFNGYLQDKIHKEMAKLYPIPRIVSEDKNSSLLGVSATVYPSLMKASKNLEYKDREFFVGAGSWHVNPESTQFPHFLEFMKLVYAGVDVNASDYGVEFAGSEESLNEFRSKRSNFVDIAEREEIVNMKEINAVSDARLIDLNRNAGPIYETSSHVLHVPMSSRKTGDLCAKIRNYEGVN